MNMSWLRRILFSRPRASSSPAERFQSWKKRNPTGTFKAFYAEQILTHLATGREHPTLGRELRNVSFEDSGRNEFERLLDFGLKPADVIVDYGCGTMRVGVHAIRYLNKGNYWGLDIHDGILQEGQELVGKELCEEKTPNFHVIDHESVAAAASAKPAFVISLAVVIHVHPEDLDEYFGNLRMLLDSGGVALMSCFFARHTIQYDERTWAYDRADIAARLRHCCLSDEIVETKKWRSKNGNAFGTQEVFLLRVTD